MTRTENKIWIRLARISRSGGIEGQWAVVGLLSGPRVPPTALPWRGGPAVIEEVCPIGVGELHRTARLAPLVPPLACVLEVFARPSRHRTALRDGAGLTGIGEDVPLEVVVEGDAYYTRDVQQVAGVSSSVRCNTVDG